MPQGKIFVLSGPSGVGKDTVAQFLLQQKNLNVIKIPTYTTRRPRVTENKSHYHFVSKNEFQKLLAEDKILEYNFYHQNYYGTPKKELEETLAKGKNALLCIDINGGINIKKKYPQAVLIFLFSSLENIRKRLIKRQSNTLQEIQKRLEIAQKEMRLKHRYDFCVENPEGRPEKAAEKISEIIQKSII